MTKQQKVCSKTLQKLILDNKIKVEYVDGSNAFSFCPFHCDKKRPNLCISIKEEYYGNFICWACGRNGCLSKEQVDRLNLSDCIAYKANRKSLDTRWGAFNKSCCDNLQKFPLLKLGLAKQLNISTKSLDEWLVGYDGTSFTIPMFREDLSEYYIEGGFCGVQRRFSDGEKRCVTGSRLGLMYPYDRIGDYYMFVCEGFSDGISVWDLGLQCIARPHCRHTEGIEELFTEGILADTETIIIIADSDTVGMEGAIELRRELQDVYYGEGEWPCDCEIFSFDGAKDIREYIAKVGKQQVYKELSRLI